jgi:hypothetical protein
MQGEFRGVFEGLSFATIVSRVGDTVHPCRTDYADIGSASQETLPCSMSYTIRMHQRIGVGLLFALAVFAFVPQVEAAGDLVGHWKFDEASGSTATDASGNGWNGTLSNVTRSTGTLPPVEFANVSSVFFNSGSSGRIVSTSLSLNNFTQFTMAGWMFPTAANDRASLFGQNDIFEFGFTDGDTIFCYTSKGEVSWDFTPGTFLNNWHHITCLATASELIMYIDGVNRASTAISAGSFGSSGDNFSIGAGAVDGGTTGPFTGYIDDVRVYSRGLTPSEMEGLGSGESGPLNAPSITSTSPADNATGVSLTANLSFTFGTTTMATSTGSIGLYKTADNSLVESFSVSSSRLTRSTGENSTTFTIDPTDAFEEGLEYYVSIASTTFRDGLNAFYEGTAASTTWSFTALDSTAPTPSSVTASSTAGTTAGISWTTGEAASTKVVFGLTESYSSTTPERDTSPRVTSHFQRLSPLAPCTTYHYAAVSRDAAGNAATSSDATFTTEGCEYDATPTSATSTAITSSAGGDTEIEDSGKTFSVSAPANATATSSSFVIQVKAIPSDDVLASLGRPGAKPEEIGTTVFDVKAIIDGTTILDSFDHPVTITYEYTDGEISGIDESSLWLYHYHDGAWEALDDCDVDTGANTIECTTESFSIFGLFGSQAQSSSGSSSGGGGTTIQGRVKNLLESGNTALAEQLMREYPQAFASVQTAAAVPSVTCPKYRFTRSLRKGMQDEDVRELQKFLNCHGFTLGASGPGAPGSETNYFAQRTFDAVVRFQEKYADEVLKPGNLSKGTGFFATYSQKKAHALMGVE